MSEQASKAAASDDVSDAVADEEDALWREMDAAEAGETPPEPDASKADETEAPDDDGAGEEADADRNDSPTDDSAPADDDDTGQGDDATPETAGADDASGSQDPWADVRPELREEYQRQETQNRRLRGQVSALQRQINELVKQTKADPGTGSSDDASDDDLARVQEEYPEVAGPLIARLRKAEDALARFQATIAGREQMEEERQVALFEEAHPDGWALIERDPDAFYAWVDDQPAAVRRDYETNADRLVNAQAAIRVMNLYRKHLDGASQGNEPGADGGAKARAELNRRERLAQVVAPPSS